jgi:hypothetical protein
MHTGDEKWPNLSVGDADKFLHDDEERKGVPAKS